MGEWRLILLTDLLSFADKIVPGGEGVEDDEEELGEEEDEEDLEDDEDLDASLNDDEVSRSTLLFDPI